jgi:hypothetical protein
MLFVTSGSLLLILAQLALISDACPIPPTITLAQYNQIKAGTTIAQMQTILGGLGYLQSLEYADPAYASISTLTYNYRGANQLPASAGLPGVINNYAMFTFNLSTQKLTYKMQYGLC